MKQILLLVLAVMFFFTGIANANSIVVLEENYNNLTAGQQLPNWMAAWPTHDTSLPTAQNVSYSSSPIGAAVANDFGVWREFQAIEGIITIDIWLDPKVGSDTNMFVRLSGQGFSDPNSIGGFGKNDTDQWLYSDNTGQHYFASLDGNGHFFRMVYNTYLARYDLYYDGNSDGDFDDVDDQHIKDIVLGETLRGVAVKGIAINSGRGGAGTTSYFDDIKVSYPADTDDDNMADDWENLHFGTIDRDGTEDWDNDGLTDALEYKCETDPKNNDSDNDGLSDGWEVGNSKDPTTPEDLTLYFPFEGSLDDISGNDNHGQQNGGVAYSQGISQQSISLDGVDDSVTIWDQAGINQWVDTTKGSISVWFKPIAHKSEHIFQYYSGNQDRLYLALFGQDSENNIGQLSGAVGFLSDDPEPPVRDIAYDSNWYHAVLTWEPDGDLNVYVNGEFYDHRVYGNPGFTFLGNEYFYLGRRWANDYHFQGNIDEFRIFNRTLTTEEIRELFLTDGDTDDDKMPDPWETENFGDTSRDGTGDYDGDGVTDRDEWAKGLDPTEIDSDGDGFGDGYEVTHFTDPTVTEAMVVFFPFNGNAEDSSAYQNHGTVTGATLTTDRFGNADSAFSFNGSSYIQVPHHDSLSPTGNQMSISMWVNADLANFPASPAPRMLSKVLSGSEEYQLFMYDSGISVFSGEEGAVSNWFVESSHSYSPNQWYHLVAVRDGNNLFLYRDGLLDSTSTTTRNLTPTTADLFIGAFERVSTGGLDGFFHGKLDDIRIFNKALSDDDVQEMFTRSVPVTKKLLYLKNGSESLTPGSEGSQYREVQTWRENGYAVDWADLSNTTITAELLGQYGVVRINGYDGGGRAVFTVEEGQSLYSWVQGGGRLVFEGAYNRLDPLVEAFGVDTVSRYDTRTGAAYADSPYSIAGITGPGTFNGTLAVEVMDQPVEGAEPNDLTVAGGVETYPAVLYGSFGSGQGVFVLAEGWSHDAAPSANTHKAHIYQGDNLGFLQAVVDWFNPDNSAPHVPSTPTPADQAVDQTDAVVLSWTGTDPDPGDTVTFDVYLDTVNPPVSRIASNLTSPTHDPASIAYVTTYYWQVVARDGYGLETVGPVWSFTTGIDPSDVDSDGMDDTWEETYWGNTSVSDGTGDEDQDGLVDLEEYRNGTDPTLADSDLDGLPDGFEVDNGADPATAEGLTVYWSFDIDASADVGGALYDGTVTDALHTTTEQRYGGGAYSFDGAGDKIAVTMPEISTLSFWLKSNETISASVDGPYIIAEIPWIVFGNFTFDLAPDNEIIGISGADGYYYWREPLIGEIDTDWHHYGFVWDDSDGAYRLFIDGVDKGPGEKRLASGKFAGGVVSFSHDASRTLNGILDEVRIYSRSMSSAEVREMYFNESPQREVILFDYCPDGPAGNCSIWVMNPDGSGKVELINDGANNRLGRISPDGRKIAYMSNASGSHELWVADSDGLNRRQLTSGVDDLRDLVWAPDSKRICYASLNDLYTIYSDGTDQQRFLDLSGVFYTLTWIPGTESVLFSWGTSKDGTEIYRIDIDGSNQVGLTNNSEQDLVYSVSPDGQNIYFSRLLAEGYRIFKMNINGTSAVQLISENWTANNVHTSPDGTKITFHLKDTSNESDVATAMADGSGVSRLTDPGTVEWPRDWGYLTAAPLPENQYPNIPSSAMPADQAVEVPITAQLSWTGGDPDAGDTVTYDIRFGTSLVEPADDPLFPPGHTTDHTITSFDPGTLTTGTTYYWQIIARDNNGAQTAGPVWSFTTVNDGDADGMPDAWETTYFGDTSRTGGDDFDGDGLSDLDEYLNGADPNKADSDSDGLPDGWEVNTNGTDPATAEGLVAFYPFEGNADDATGNGYDGAVYGAVITNDRFDNPAGAYDFDGSSTIRVTNFDWAPGTGDFSFGAWVKFPETGNETGYILDTHNTANTYGDRMALMLANVGYWYPFSQTNQGDSTRIEVGETTSLNDDTWHLLYCTRQGGTTRIYLDGLPANSGPDSEDIQATGLLTIGGSAYNSYAPDRSLVGVIDDVRIFNRALSDAEVLAQYLASTPYTDEEGPIIEITIPANLPYYKPILMVMGTVSDAISGVQDIKVKISTYDDWFTYYLSDNLTWVLDETWITPTVSGSEWSISMNNVWFENLAYTIHVQATDTSNNTSSVERSFIYADIKTATTITCEIDRSSIILGELATISGDINIVGVGGEYPSNANVDIKFYHESNPDSLRKLVTIPANALGHFSYDLQCDDIDRSGQWVIVASWPGDSKLEPAESAALTLAVEKAETSLTLRSYSQATKIGEGLSLSGKFTPQPDCGGDLSGTHIVMMVVDPDNNVDSFNITERGGKVETSGRFLLQDYTGFTKLGDYTVTAQFYLNDAYLGSISDSAMIKVVENSGYAIVVQGRTLSKEGEYDHNKTTDLVYDTLKSRGLLDDDIYYLNYDFGNRTEIDERPGKAALQYAIEVWARDKMIAAPANLYLVMVDHGASEVFFLEDEQLTPSELDTYFDHLEGNLYGTNAEGQEIISVLGFCHAGSFIPALSAPGRVVITSAAANEKSNRGTTRDENQLRQGEYFVAEFFKEVRSGKNVRECFVEATRRTETKHWRGNANGNEHPHFDKAKQHPLLDDNGDMLGSNDLEGANGDGSLSGGLFIGFNTTQTNPAETAITRIAPTRFLDTGQGSADLWSEVADTSQMDDIWLEVMRPQQVELAGDYGQIYMDLAAYPLSEQSVVEAATRYAFDSDPPTGDWSDIGGFSDSGLYKVFYMTRDLEGNISPYTLGLVYKNDPANSPSLGAFTLVSPVDNAETTTSVVLDWTSSIDPDGDRVTYTALIAKNDPSLLNTPYADGMDIIRKELIPQTRVLVSSEDGIDDLSTYFWTVQAVDEYGAIKNAGSVRMFQTNNANVPAVYFDGFVVDYTSHLPLAGASLTLENHVAITDEQGYFLTGVELPEGEYTLVASADAYKIESTGIELTSDSDPARAIFTLVPEGIEGLKGDVDGEGGVTLADAILVLRVMANAEGAAQIRGDYATVGVDVNGNHVVEMEEAIYILQHVAGMRIQSQ